MTRAVKLVVLAGVFLAGYYVGQRPGSPDIFAKAGEAYRGLRGGAHETAAAPAPEPSDPAPKRSLLDRLFDQAGGTGPADEAPAAAAPPRVRTWAREVVSPTFGSRAPAIRPTR